MKPRSAGCLVRVAVRSPVEGRDASGTPPENVRSRVSRLAVASCRRSRRPVVPSASYFAAVACSVSRLDMHRATRASSHRVGNRAVGAARGKDAPPDDALTQAFRAGRAAGYVFPVSRFLPRSILNAVAATRSAMPSLPLSSSLALPSVRSVFLSPSLAFSLGAQHLSRTKIFGPSPMSSDFAVR